MSSELERRLEGLFAEAPQPDPGAGEEALHRALRAIHPVAPARRGLRTAVLVFAAAAVLLGIAAGSLAAAGALHVSFSQKPKPRPAITQLVLPRGADGIATIVGGRLSVVTKAGFRLQGLPVSSASLSPHAWFVAAGVGHSLVAMAPDGRRAWSHPAGGSVTAIAWAPFGNRIAYITRTGHGLVLRLIWGDGTHGRIVDRSVRAVRPSWRADSLAFAYVGAGGRAIVYDVGHKSRHLLAPRAPVGGLAFAPAGDSLAVRQADAVWLTGATGTVRVAGRVQAFGWFGRRLAVVVPRIDFTLVRLLSPSGVPHGFESERGDVTAITPRFLVVRRNDGLIVGDTTLLSLPPRSWVQMIEIR